MTVGKTFVAEAIRKHEHELLAARRAIKNARPRRLPRNLVWAADLTGKTTLDARTHAVLGILEHASRAVLCLEALQRKSSWALIARLAEAVRRYGKPHALRTDNEPVFTSRAFLLALVLLGIRHQRIDPPLAEQPRGALLRHPQAQARPPRRRLGRRAQPRPRRVP
ncbi:MAG: integrase catalytic domain-containing protein, partial [Burkholderiales bacterium]